jgi:hypothetical protein
MTTAKRRAMMTLKKFPHLPHAQRSYREKAKLKKPRNATSPIWKQIGLFLNFTVLEKAGKPGAVCRTCWARLTYKGSTTNLRKHLKLHPNGK